MKKEGVENRERERWSRRLVETERELRQGQTGEDGQKGGDRNRQVETEIDGRLN